MPIMCRKQGIILIVNLENFLKLNHSKPGQWKSRENKVLFDYNQNDSVLDFWKLKNKRESRQKQKTGKRQKPQGKFICIVNCSIVNENFRINLWAMLI